MGKTCTEIVEARRTIEHRHTLTHHLLLRIGGTKIVELLAPQINLVTEVDLDVTYRLTTEAERAGADITAMGLSVAKHAKVDANGARDEVTIRIAS